MGGFLCFRVKPAIQCVAEKEKFKNTKDDNNFQDDHLPEGSSKRQIFETFVVEKPDVFEIW